MVASVAGAVNLTGDFADTAEDNALDSDETSSIDTSSVPVCKHPKLSTEMAAKIPPQGIAPPAELIIVNIYFNSTRTEDLEELGNYTIEILNARGNRIVAEIYTKEILEIADLPFVSYMDMPLKAQLFPDVTVMSFRADGDITGGGEVHGTACAEIVHDVAPDAELYLVSYDGYSYQLEAVVNYLILEEVDIVSNSAGGTTGLFALQLSCIKQCYPRPKNNQYGYGLPNFGG
jgi:hypothetical protein